MVACTARRPLHAAARHNGASSPSCLAFRLNYSRITRRLLHAMINAKTIDEIAQKLADSMPKELQDARNDIKKNLRAGLEGLLHRMELVTREEYDVQSALLRRSRAKLEQLESKLQQLEAKLDSMER